MAGWLSALKLVPWVEVVRSAPQIAEGARKLWQTVGGRKPAPPAPSANLAPVDGTEPMPALLNRLAALEREMAEASTLIHSLAEQDKQLVGQIARLQQRERWLTRALGVLGVAGLAMAWHLWGG